MQVFKWVMWLVTGGFLSGYRTQVLGIAMAAGAVINAVAAWAVGDTGIAGMFEEIQQHWEVIAIGLGLWFGGDKINAASGKPELVENNE